MTSSSLEEGPMCGGEDPVEYIPKLQERAHNAEAARRRWLDEAALSEIKTKGLANELGSRLRECEEALRSADAEHEKFRAAVTEPLNAREGRSVESLSWDELLGVANRNLNEALDLGRDRDSLLDLVQRLLDGTYDDYTCPIPDALRREARTVHALCRREVEYIPAARAEKLAAALREIAEMGWRLGCRKTSDIAHAALAEYEGSGTDG